MLFHQAVFIQVCFSLDKSSTYEREIRALLKFGRELQCDKMIILSNEMEKTETAKWFGITGEIRHVPISKWRRGGSFLIISFKGIPMHKPGLWELLGIL
jgi:hypothetical protein